MFAVPERVPSGDTNFEGRVRLTDSILRKSDLPVGRLFGFVSTQSTLANAWQKIRANGMSSRSSDTRFAVEQFDQHASRNIRRLQTRLRKKEFEFDPQVGITANKSGGRGKRGIVLATVHNRVVERAILDVLQQRVPFVKEVLDIPTSIGGVPRRSVPHGLRIIRDAFGKSYHHFARSDISGFFDGVPRKQVLRTISDHVSDDQQFVELIDRASLVVLANEARLGEDKAIFPTDTEGVAQGSPLSPLFGNILLRPFDDKFNQRDIVCVRFIDDFLILGKSEKSVRKAYNNAEKWLGGMGMSCHSPYSGNAPKEKASAGRVEDGFVFLGYDIRPGQFQPSRKARLSIKSSVRAHIEQGKLSICQVKEQETSLASEQRYAQTLVVVDRVLRGWGNAFAYSNSPNTMSDLDLEVDKIVAEFRGWYRTFSRDFDWKMKRRTGGVCMLTDIKAKSLDDLPFEIEPGKRFVTSARTLTVSTDGSVLTAGNKKGKDRGPGGWAYVIHDTGEEVSGSCPSATNNQMELRAVVEALTRIPAEKSIKIRTDSQHICRAIKNQSQLKSNQALWERLGALIKQRSVKFVWVKGHAGDRFNERADELAQMAARTEEH